MAMPSVAIIDPLVLLPFAYYQMRSFQALNQFKKEKASPQSAKQVKKSAYMPFVVLLGGFVGTTIYNRYNTRRERDEMLYRV